jgi:hypothetical protein
VKTTKATATVSIEAIGEEAAKACEANAAAAIDATWKKHWEHLAKEYRGLAARSQEAETQMTSSQTIYRDFEGSNTRYTGKDYRARRGSRVKMQAILKYVPGQGEPVRVTTNAKLRELGGVSPRDHIEVSWIDNDGKLDFATNIFPVAVPAGHVDYFGRFFH